MKAVLDDHRTAAISEPLRAMLTFLEKMTLTPDALGPEDVAPLRAAGLSGQAMREAIHVAAVFNVYDRLADALGWDIPPLAAFKKSATLLLKFGYD